jgi:hypothetical protein
MLVRGTLEQVQALAEWDEVAYIFPASGELVTGLPLVGCLGGATEAGQVGQLTQRVGEGWDGAGLNRASLTYSFQGGVPARLSEAEVQAEIQRAMTAWSGVVQVDFQRTNSGAGTKNINILFGSRDHGDQYSFDGVGRVLAHTFYPAPPNPEPIAGDLHFDNDEAWNVGTDIDVFSVALHELGHALGLGHSDVPNAVMYPYYRRASALTPEDIGAVRMLYAAGNGDVPAAPAPLVLVLSAPANSASTTAAAINVSGTLTGAVGTPGVRWQTNRGLTGVGTIGSDGRGGFQWQMASVPLSIGENQITVIASDAAGRSISRGVDVKRESTPATPVTPAPGPTPSPTPALSVDITSPGGYAVVTRNTISAYGSVSGGAGQPSVRWTTDRGSSGTATVSVSTGGNYRWDVGSMRLQLGGNTVTVIATEPGRTGVRTFLIVYRYPSDDEPDSGEPTPPASPVPTPAPIPTPVFNLDISSPGADSIVTKNPVAATGTIVGATGQLSVRWSSDRGFSGTGVVTAIPDGKYRWDANPIGLQMGVNTITVTATDIANHTSTRSFRVTYNARSEEDPDADGQAPRVTVVTPNTTFLMTSIYSLSVRGTAFDSSGVQEVRWECSCGLQGIAQGTSQWTILNIGLPVGTHTIKVIARDSAGNEGIAAFTVFRYEN